MESKKIAIAEEIMRNKDILSRTDYQALKYAEGEISESEYAPIKAQRRECREVINRLEAEYLELLNL